MSASCQRLKSSHSPFVRQIYVLGCTNSNLYHIRLDGANGVVASATVVSTQLRTVEASDLVVLIGRENSNEVSGNTKEARESEQRCSFVLPNGVAPYWGGVLRNTI